MLVGFIGSPSSCKTTVAVSMFSHFKRLCINTELVIEQARQYIAEMKWNNNLPNNNHIVLSNEDQIAIVKRQLNMEEVMVKSCGLDTIVISDSSALNAYLYLDLKNRQILEDFFFNEVVNKYDLLFYCLPLPDLDIDPSDNNRVHDINQIQVLQHEANLLFEKIKRNGNVMRLAGDIDTRIGEACTITLDKKKFILERSIPNVG